MREMKDSGIDWIGEIPAHWEVKRLKSIFTECKELSTTGEEDLLSVSEYYGVARRLDVKDEDEFDSRAESLEGYKICQKDDLVINIMLAWKRGLGFSDFDGIVSPAYAVYRGKGIIPHFYHYLLRSDRYIAEFKRNSKGIIDSRLRLYTDRFFAIKTIVPPIEEQQAIADYLDTKTAEIDEQISLLEQKQNAYAKLKQSLISQVVTRGLSPNAPLKDSGIDWIGEIPAHWEVRRFKELFRNYTTGFTPDSKDMSNFSDDENKTWVTIADLSSRIITQSNMCLSEKALQKHLPVITPKDSLLFSFKLSIGKTAFAGKDLYTNEAIVSIPPQRRIDLKYYFYHLPDVCFNNATENIYGAKMLNQKLIANMIMLFPPIEEQQVIADYLDKKTAEIDNNISLIDQKIKAYKRLKQSLIDEVVTGKRKI